MSVSLKRYQVECLDELAAFLRAARDETAERAFNAKRRPSGSYRAIPGWKESAAFPYVCVRVPTGGGKTLMAAHAVSSVCKNYLSTERHVVLWLAPSDAIVQQTLRLLKDRGSATHRALADAFGGQIAVLDIEEALYISVGTLQGACTIIVSTAQSWRVEAKNGRKVYQPDNGALMGHFDNVDRRILSRLEQSGAGRPVYSLANVLKMRKPIVIIDEGHRFRTKLTFETLKGFSPSAVIEFTATPYVDGKDRVPSNVLVEATAADLKAANMIKAPIILKESRQWTDAVRLAIAKRTELARACAADEKRTGRYVRPIVLLQAQPDLSGKKCVTVDVLKKHLIESQGVKEDEVAVHTGEHKGLPDNILSPACKVNYVITVQALGEGWDCPFAYILCSVATISSSVAVEQILGRVLRMPHVMPRDDVTLNQAYCFTSSGDFGEASRNLQDALVDAGFAKDEAEGMVKGAEGEGDRDDAPLFRNKELPIFVDKALTVDERAAIKKIVPGHVNFESASSGAATLILYKGDPIDAKAEKALSKILDDKRDPQASKRFQKASWGEDDSPAALKAPFDVPGLIVEDGNSDCGYTLFDSQHQETDWSLVDCPHELNSSDFDATPGRVKTTEIDVETGSKWIEQFKGELHELVNWQDQTGPRTIDALSAWLDREIEDAGVTQADKRSFIDRVLLYLSHQRNLKLETLVPVRWRLAEAIAQRIDDHRIHKEHSEFQLLLESVAEIPGEPHPSVVFSFARGLGVYPALRHYTGAARFNKHYYKNKGVMNDEEARCAQLIDAHPNTKVWVRNLDRLDYSFWLPTLTNRFFPDFVAQLHDGRYAAIEYKGEHIEEKSSELMKLDVGKRWEARSNGKCVFLWVTSDDPASVIEEGLAPAK